MYSVWISCSVPQQISSKLSRVGLGDGCNRTLQNLASQHCIAIAMTAPPERWIRLLHASPRCVES